jgi:hypothetical protein
MGMQGLFNLYRFVEQGGTLITEGSTATLFPEYNFAPGVSVQASEPGYFARGIIVRGQIDDNRSPLAYGIGYNEMGIYFNGSPILNAGGGGGGRGGRGGRGGGVSQNISPMGTNPPPVTAFSPGGIAIPPPTAGEGGGRGGRGGGGRAGGGGRGGAAADSTALAAGGGRGAPAAGGGRGAGRGGGGGGGGAAANTPRVIVSVPDDPDQILLSGGLEGGDQLAGRALLVTSQVGQGHVVMFGMRPFWRWQTHGTYVLGFNAILNWNDLGAGRPTAPAGGGAGGRGRGGDGQ